MESVKQHDQVDVLWPAEPPPPLPPPHTTTLQAHLGSGDSSALLRGCHRCLSWGLSCPSWRCGHVRSCSPHWKTSTCCSLESLTVALHPHQPVLFHCSITSVLWCAASASGSGEFLRVGRHREKCWGIYSVYCFSFCKKQHKYRGANLWKFQQLFFLKGNFLSTWMAITDQSLKFVFS